MNPLLLQFDRFWYRPAPAERLAALRMLVGAFAVGLLAVRYQSFTGVAHMPLEEFVAVGPVRLLSAPLPVALVQPIQMAAILAGIAFLTGFRYRWFGPLFAALLLWVTSYRCSWGLKHTENLITLHVLLLAFAPAADAWSLDVRRRHADGPSRAEHGRYGWAIQAMSVVTVLTYFVAGVSKLKLMGLTWASGDAVRAQFAYSTLRNIELGAEYSSFGVTLARATWPFAVFGIVTLLVELGAPLALFGGRIGRCWAAAAWLFHAGVAALMAIAFPYHLSAVAYASFFHVERLRGLARREALEARF